MCKLWGIYTNLSPPSLSIWLNCLLCAVSLGVEDTLTSWIASLRSTGMRAGPIQCGAGIEESLILISPKLAADVSLCCTGLWDWGSAWGICAAGGLAVWEGTTCVAYWSRWSSWGRESACHKWECLVSCLTIRALGKYTEVICPWGYLTQVYLKRGSMPFNREMYSPPGYSLSVWCWRLS